MSDYFTDNYLELYNLFPLYVHMENKLNKTEKETEFSFLSEIVDEKKKDDSKGCSVCFESEAIIAFSCGHKKTCACCSFSIMKTTRKCPICRAEVKFALRIFD